MISLIGMPGCGKTTVGRQLARRLRTVFIDSDRIIEERIGCSIRELFEREGEEAPGRAMAGRRVAGRAPRTRLLLIAV